MACIEVFDPPLCCPTGVCGPQADGDLARVAADLDWLVRQGVHVRRYNLAQEPDVFLSNAQVKQLLERTDGEGLPAVVVDGRIVKWGSYPSRHELALWAGTPAAQNPAADQISADPRPGITDPRDTPGHRTEGCCGPDQRSSCCSPADSPLVTLDLPGRTAK